MAQIIRMNMKKCTLFSKLMNKTPQTSVLNNDFSLKNRHFTGSWLFRGICDKIAPFHSSKWLWSSSICQKYSRHTHYTQTWNILLDINILAAFFISWKRNNILCSKFFFTLCFIFQSFLYFLFLFYRDLTKRMATKMSIY